MLEKSERERIIALVKHWVVPAIGCTEPMCVALAVARATEELGECPQRIDVWLSPNILKNAMGVGIPGTGMVGLPIAIALGALVGRSAYGLEVLRDVQPEHVEAGKRYVEGDRIHISLKDLCPDKLYVEVTCSTLQHSVTAVIAHEHTRFERLEKDGSDLLGVSTQNGMASSDDDELETEVQLTLKKVFDFATTAPLEEIAFIDEARQLNESAAQQSLQGNYGHCLGKALSRPLGRGMMGDSIFLHILSSTACACDARMAGAKIPVMSNSGSGNQAFVPLTCGGVCAGESQYARGNATGTDAQSPDGYLCQAEFGRPVGLVRLRGGVHRFELRHYLFDGRRLPGGVLRREEYDCQSDRHDLRRRQTQLRPQTDHGRQHGCVVSHAGHAGQLRVACGGHY